MSQHLQGDAFFFAPTSRATLKNAVVACAIISMVGDCNDGVHGTFNSWSVSAVSDMSNIFERAHSFNADISKWDVSATTAIDGAVVAAGFGLTCCRGRPGGSAFPGPGLFRMALQHDHSVAFCPVCGAVIR